jgi:cytochrome c-type biogenesis protein CcmH
MVYQHTGAKSDWDIAQTLQQARHKAAAGESTEADVTRLLQQLQQRLQQRPEDPHYLMLLAGTEMDRQNYPAATDAYQRLASLHPDDPSVLARYAQALYLSSDRTLSTQVQAIADKALAINPQQPTVLGMLGIASFEQREFQQAIDYWQRLLPMLGPVSPNRQMISSGIEQAKAKLVEAGIAVADAPTSVQASTSAASLDVEVSIGESINADSNAIVFVFARAVAGPRMPLAVARIRVADLPARITLDDSMAMAPGLKLSSFEEVEVVARISKNGIANPGSGDIEGRLGPIELATTSGALSILINQIVP